jgi:ketosteroid isomerase-like protein
MKALFVIPLLFLLACNSSSSKKEKADSESPKVILTNPDVFDPDAMRDTFMRLEKLHSALLVRGSYDSLMELYDKSARVCPETGTFITGRTAIRAYWEKEDCMMTHERNMISLDGDGGLAYEMGIETGSQCGTKNHNREMWNFKYVTIWKKQFDGSWKIVLESWNRMEE